MILHLRRNIQFIVNEINNMKIYTNGTDTVIESFNENDSNTMGMILKSIEDGEYQCEFTININKKSIVKKVLKKIIIKTRV